MLKLLARKLSHLTRYPNRSSFVGHVKRPHKIGSEMNFIEESRIVLLLCPREWDRELRPWVKNEGRGDTIGQIEYRCAFLKKLLIFYIILPSTCYPGNY